MNYQELVNLVEEDRLLRTLYGYIKTDLSKREERRRNESKNKNGR